MDLDSHADTAALGREGVVMQFTGKKVTVEGFGKSVGTIGGVPVCTIAVAYDDPKTGQTYVLVFHQALYIPDLDVHLINPFQLRNHGLVVNDVPLQHLPPHKRTVDSHSIISNDGKLTIPLELKGTMSGFTIRTPTLREKY
jgi:hypothetical protein